jgi:ureidoglycolate hydrolase
MMKIQTVFHDTFSSYGKVVEGYDFAPLLGTLRSSTEKPADAVIYIPSEGKLEELPSFLELQDHAYGGMPIQIGYCNGSNTKLNCLEYHRDSEINIPADDIVLLLAHQDDIKNGKLDTSTIQAFFVPTGTAVELYATTLHYAPCNAKQGVGFRVAVVLPRNTNTDKPAISSFNAEDSCLWACNKWLLAHPESSEAAQGAYVGLTGKNFDISEWNLEVEL